MTDAPVPLAEQIAAVQSEIIALGIKACGADAYNARESPVLRSRQNMLRVVLATLQQHALVMAALREARMYMSKYAVKLVAQRTGIDVDTILGEPK